MLRYLVEGTLRAKQPITIDAIRAVCQADTAHTSSASGQDAEVESDTDADEDGEEFEEIDDGKPEEPQEQSDDE